MATTAAPQEDLCISEVHILFQRHAQATSNIVGPDTPDVIDPRSVSLEDLRGLVEEVGLLPAVGAPRILRYGAYLPDGLTGYGEADVQAFVRDVGGAAGDRKLENVYMLASSPLTRAFQTLQATSKACHLVGSLHHGDEELPKEQEDGNTDTIIYCHPGIQEATAWPQDFPALVDRNGAASYLKLKGGKGTDAGERLGETTVDLTKMVWAEGVVNRWVTLQDRLDAVTEQPDLDAIKEAARTARAWLRDCAKRVLQMHREANGQGVPKIIVCLHGGIINFLTQNWYCSYARNNDTEEWQWAGSAGLRNLEVNVYTFDSLADKEAKLTEVDWDRQYADVLGKYYRHMASDQSLVYKNPDGTHVDQEAGHWKFIQDVSKEVREVSQERPEVMKAYMSWTGVSEFLAAHNAGS